MTDISLIKAAEKRLHGVIRRTPMLCSPFLDDIAGRRVFVKAECLQHTGSFKFRGGWSALSGMPAAARTKGVLAFSSGNHAQGVALAAREHQVPAVILMPDDAPRMKIANTRALGAKVVLYDRATETREAIGKRLQNQHGLSLVKPFDDPLVIAGQGTCGLEIATQAAEEGIERAEVLVPCGGGGLTSGIALALRAKAALLQVRPVEPAGFDDMARSLACGQIRRNDTNTGSICDAILTPSPGQITFPILQGLCGSGLVVTDQQVLQAMALAFARLKIVIEPGGAVALAAALFHGTEINGKAVIVVATGGNVDGNIFRRALEQYGCAP